MQRYSHPGVAHEYDLEQGLQGTAGNVAARTTGMSVRHAVGLLRQHTVHLQLPLPLFTACSYSCAALQPFLTAAVPHLWSLISVAVGHGTERIGLAALSVCCGCWPRWCADVAHPETCTGLLLYSLHAKVGSQDAHHVEPCESLGRGMRNAWPFYTCMPAQQQQQQRRPSLARLAGKQVHQAG